MLIAVIDTETTGFSAENDSVVEVAVCLYDPVWKTTIKSYSTLVYTQAVPDQVAAIHGITTEILNSAKLVLSSEDAKIVGWLINQSDALMAHNAKFDKPFMAAYFQKAGVKVDPKPWICSYKDIRWPTKSKKLGHIATDLGLGYMTPGAHRALADTQMLCEALGKLDDLSSQLIDILDSSERFVYLADVDYHNRELAKAAGFFWDKGFEFNSKKGFWRKDMKDAEAKKLSETIPLIKVEA